MIVDVECNALCEITNDKVLGLVPRRFVSIVDGSGAIRIFAAQFDLCIAVGCGSSNLREEFLRFRCCFFRESPCLSDRNTSDT